MTEYRPYDVIEAELNAAFKEYRELQKKAKEADEKWSKLLSESCDHPVFKAQLQKEIHRDLRKWLRPYLYDELVTKRDFKAVRIAKWRCETRKRNIYNSCESITVEFLDGQTFTAEMGEWGSMGHDFNHAGKVKEKSIAGAWAACCKTNPPTDRKSTASAIMALANMALEWDGYGDVLDKHGEEEVCGFGEEDKHEAELTPGLYYRLMKVLELEAGEISYEDPVASDEDEPPQKKRKVE
jgi:hypothetical protein